MKAQWNAQLEQINIAFQNWENTYTTLPSSFSYQSSTIQTEELNVFFIEIIQMMKVISERDDVNSVLLAIQNPSITSLSSTINQTVSGLPSNPQSGLEQLTSNLWSIFSSIAWILPPDSRGSISKSVEDLNVIGMVESSQKLIDQIVNSSESVNNSVSQLNNLEVHVQDLVSKINGYEREASNAKTNAEASATTATSNKEAVSQLLTELANGINEHKELLTKIDSLSMQAGLVLEGTSKAGLAGSFANRRVTLEAVQKSWGRSFTIGIVGLVLVVILTTTGIIELPALVNPNGKVDIGAVIARLMITGPAVWYTWFAARQYSHTMRLIEDYAFKEASALAFVGYKREMEEDDEMIKLLRELAIKNFGSSPTRMLNKSEPSSPIHDLVDKALENQGVFDKVIQLLKALKPEKGKD